MLVDILFIMARGSVSSFNNGLHIITVCFSIFFCILIESLSLKDHPHSIISSLSVNFGELYRDFKALRRG